MGVKAPLEAFKTATKGWGIRATRTIEEGAYICSYAGEVPISLRAVKGSGDGPGLGALVDDSVVVSLVLWSLSGVCFFFLYARVLTWRTRRTTTNERRIPARP